MTETIWKLVYLCVSFTVLLLFAKLVRLLIHCKKTFYHNSQQNAQEDSCDIELQGVAVQVEIGDEVNANESQDAGTSCVTQIVKPEQDVEAKNVNRKSSDFVLDFGSSLNISHLLQTTDNFPPLQQPEIYNPQTDGSEDVNASSIEQESHLESSEVVEYQNNGTIPESE